MAINREIVPLDDQWDLSPIFQSLASWEEAFAKELQVNYTASLDEYRNQKELSVAQVKHLYDTLFAHDRRLSKLYTYAHLLHDQQVDYDAASSALQRISSHYHTFSEAFSWVEPKLLSHSLESLQGFCRHPELAPYSIILERLLRKKAHTLTEEQETLLAMAARAMECSQKAFSMMSDADFRFPDVLDSTGNQRPLTQANYSMLLRDPDRTLRKNAYEAVHNQYTSFQNTICELLRGVAERHFFEARARNFSSCLEAALHPHNIPVEVYKKLITTVHSRLDLLHRYVRIKKRELGVEKLYPWDLYVSSPSSNPSRSFSFDEACALVLGALSPLGSNYVETLSTGMLHNRWIDKYENRGKRSGAYSSGCYDSPPYILMNYKPILRDVFTLAHEAGHSMHTEYSRTQPYHLYPYAIFVAEVASTLNETLLAEELLRRYANSPHDLKEILHEQIEDLRATLFRQTLFAEFELFIHELIENNRPCTPTVLKQKFLELNRCYYGDDLEIPESLGVEWARIPHFYYNFYVYQYATGVSAALSVAKKITSGKIEDLNAYLRFLHSGSSKFPLDLLREAGVDMRSEQPITEALDHFSSLLDRYEQVCGHDI